jgi:hypothetical protein
MAALKGAGRRLPCVSYHVQSKRPGEKISKGLGPKTNATHNLLDIHVSGASAANANANVIVGEILLRNVAQLRFESCREEEVMVVTVLICVCIQQSERSLEGND